jgi:serine protease Do
VVGAIHYGPDMVGRIAYAVEVNRVRAARSELAELSEQDRLSGLSGLFNKVAMAVKPAVVEVRVSKKVPAGGGGRDEFEEFLRRHFGEEGSPFGRPRTPGPPREYSQRGLGSGVIVDAKNGYIVTNYHVVVGADEVRVVLADKRVFQAEWVRVDPQTDLAVVKIKPDRLIEAPLGDSDRMRVGHLVMAIGAPRELAQTVTTGIISAKGRSGLGVGTSRANMYQNYLQTDAAINRGNSGGPLVNMGGEVVGINNSILSYSGGFEGIGFAIPSDMVKHVLKQLIENKKVVRGYLGVRIQDVDERLARSFKLPDTKGALVASVARGTPAAKGGIQDGDFIVAVGGKPTPDVNRLRHVVAEIAPGKAVDVTVYRDGRKKTLKVTLEVQPDNMVAAGPPSRPGPPERTASWRFGLTVATLTGELAAKAGYDKDARGVLVTGVRATSDAAEQGIARGMLITRAGGKAVATAGEFARALAGKDAAGGVRLRVETPDGGRRFVFVTPTNPNK